MLTVNEVADKLNVSKATVYNRLKEFQKDLKPFIKVVKGIRYIDIKGFEYLEKSILGLNNDAEIINDINEDLKQDTTTPDATIYLKDINLLLQSENEHLRKQIDIKDYQICELNKALSQSQKLNENNQILLREQKVNMLDDGNKSFWNRLFKK